MNAADETGSSGIIAALEFEARSARALTQHGWRLWVSGMGAVKARRAADGMFAAGVRRILVWGTAGGLDPHLATGTLFLPDVILDARSGVEHAVSPAFHAELVRTLGAPGVPAITRGRLLTTQRALYTPQEKTTAGTATGALMVDMETAAIADAAASAGAEFAALRVLLDAAGATLPPVVVASVDSLHPHLSVLVGLMKRPQDLPAVMRLGQAFRRAHASLVTAANALASEVGH
ncbi:MAG: hypothetical protein ACRETQ_07525 [Gammaproteobacteria bacterium]